MKANADRRRVGRAAVAALLAAVLSTTACGAAAQNYYQTSVAKLEDCCSHLADPSAVETCRQGIPRIDNPAAETSAVNQDTFRCVDRYFQCDASTGHATQPSAQAQLDCITDLGTQ